MPIHVLQELTVDLLRDGQVFDTVKLNEKNNWRYVWDGLSDRYEWTVTEREVSGYTVKVEKEGVTYTVTNTVVPKTPPEEPPEKPPYVPQTGLLWWPVPILAVCGLAVIGVGMIRRRKNTAER